MEFLLDPELLRDREGVAFSEETRVVDRAEFESAHEFDSHAVVGVTNDEGAVLLMDDGSHGWTLAAFPVEPDADWVATGRRGAENLTGTDIELARPERVRRIDFALEEDTERRTTVYTVVFRASPVEGRPVAAELEDEDENENEDVNVRDVGWFDEVPVEQDGAVADDIRLFLERS